MKVRPLHDRLFVKRVEEHETVVGGIVIPDSAKEKPQRGEVFAVGTGRRSKDGKIIPLELRAGDQILFGKFAGSEIVLDGDEYLVLREDEVLCVLDTTSQGVKAA
jgi:chaperonin GroES